LKEGGGERYQAHKWWRKWGEKNKKKKEKEEGFI
jgi:hypothetical protein